MHKRLKTIFKESFIPVLLIVLALGFLLVYADFETSLRANQIVTIEIQPHLQTSDSSESNDNITLSDFALSDLDEESTLNPKIKEARVLVEQENWKDAEALYLSLLKEEPDSLAYSEYAVMHIKLGNLDKAKQALKKATSMDPIHVNAFVNRGLIKAREKKKYFPRVKILGKP